MASVIFHAFNQIKATGALKLFKSHNPAYADGGQMRDFIYVKDLCAVLMHFFHTRKNPRIYNLGTGQAETFNTLADSIFESMGLPVHLTYIDIPIDIREKYQYFTQATTAKLRSAGYTAPFLNLRTGAVDYITNYLAAGLRF